jgi:hypothetical protein
VHAEQGERAEIGLNARAATGIRSGDGHHPQRGVPGFGQWQV